MIKIGSLFDGIGGTPLSAVLSGAEPVWASEIEKVPISITKRHFPNMTHLGDITKIDGAEIEPVDIIVGGSPCQDLSVAGKRAGLAGERSGLFMDQIRIIKEMRNATSKQTGNGSDKIPRPRYMVWENVPGAFSSNEGEDFRAVLEETAKVADSTVSIPRSVTGWANAGSILADGFSISWRTFDAQYWGVPQRRRRIYLVADFGGQSAPEILFEQPCVSRDSTESRCEGQGTARDVKRGADDAVLFENHGTDSRITGPLDICPTVTSRYGTGGNNTPLIASIESKTVRRLTPLECERLQGYPDNWTEFDKDGKQVSDSQRYKALGNSFAIPNAVFVIGGCVERLQED